MMQALEATRAVNWSSLIRKESDSIQASRTAMIQAVEATRAVDWSSLIRNEFEMPQANRAAMEEALSAAGRLQWDAKTERHFEEIQPAVEPSVAIDEDMPPGDSEAQKAFAALFRAVRTAVAALLGPIDGQQRREIILFIIAVLAFAITLMNWYDIEPPRLP